MYRFMKSLKFKKVILRSNEDCHLSIYNKVIDTYAVADFTSKLTEHNFESSRPTMFYYIFLYRSDHTYDDVYDFRLIVDEYQLKYVTDMLSKYQNLSYEGILEWFKYLSDEVHTLVKVANGPFGGNIAYNGSRTTRDMMNYHVFNSDDLKTEFKDYLIEGGLES